MRSKEGKILKGQWKKSTKSLVGLMAVYGSREYIKIASMERAIRTCTTLKKISPENLAKKVQQLGNTAEVKTGRTRLVLKSLLKKY